MVACKEECGTKHFPEFLPVARQFGLDDGETELLPNLIVNLLLEEQGMFGSDETSTKLGEVSERVRNAVAEYLAQLKQRNLN